MLSRGSRPRLWFLQNRNPQQEAPWPDVVVRMKHSLQHDALMKAPHFVFERTPGMGSASPTRATSAPS